MEYNVVGIHGNSNVIPVLTNVQYLKKTTENSAYKKRNNN